MQWHGQNQEDKIISEFFGSVNGRLLSIGENDGESYSNARYLLLHGWDGVLVEPAPEAFARLAKLYEDRQDVGLVNKAIGESDYRGVLFDMGEHVIPGSHSLLATIKPREIGRWPGVEFSAIDVEVISVSTLLKEYAAPAFFDLVIIDAEGMDYTILKQFSFEKMMTRCVCVEWNGLDWANYSGVMSHQGFRLLTKNSENLIWIKD